VCVCVCVCVYLFTVITSNFMLPVFSGCIPVEITAVICWLITMFQSLVMQEAGCSLYDAPYCHSCEQKLSKNIYPDRVHDHARSHSNF